MFDVEASLSEARGKFKALIDYLLDEGQGDDAYRTEVKIFRELLAIGLYLVAAWFMKKLGGNVGKAIVTAAGARGRRSTRGHRGPSRAAHFGRSPPRGGTSLPRRPACPSAS